jgi:hypothetical protein
MKYLRKEAAKACPIHTAVYTAALDALVMFGVFSKDDVIESLNFDAVADSIRWDYIREFIEEEQGVEMIPLAASFFSRHRVQEEHINPAKFLAQGYGKKTHGFAAVTTQNDHLVIKRIEQRKAITNGVAKSFQVYLEHVDNRRVAQGQPSLRAPDPKLSKPDEDVRS